MADIVQLQKTGQIGKDNDPEWPTVTYGPGRTSHRPERARVVLPWQALALLLGAGLAVLAFGWWRYDSYCAAYDNPCWWHAPALTSMGVLSLMAALAGWLYTRLQIWQAQADAERNEARTLPFVRTRYGDPEHVSVHEGAQALELAVSRYLAATQLEQAIAPHKRYSGIETLNEGAHTEVKTDLGAPPLLAAPAETSGLIPPDTFLPWLMELHHAMIAGGTGTGKTTFARIVLGERLRQGYSGLVIDPKGKDWYGLPVVGGGRKFGEILSALDSVRQEMDRRFDAYGNGVRDFEPLVVLVDEVPDIMEACRDDRRRVVDGRWMRFVKQLGSLAREVQISVVLLTQSPLVEDVGMNSAMRKNFTRVALGDEAPALIADDTDAKHRQELRELLKGQAYPAALYRRGAVHLLDTASVPTLADRPVRDAQGWQPRALVVPAAPDLATHAQRVLQATQGNRAHAAAVLLSRRGTRVQGRWEWTVKEVARALAMRDEDVSAIGRPE